MKTKKDVSMVKCLCATGVGEDFLYEILSDDIREYSRAIGLVEGHENTFCKLRMGLFYRDIFMLQLLFIFRYDFLENRYTFDMNKDCIYLDYASTYPRHPQIIKARQEFEFNSYANIGR